MDISLHGTRGVLAPLRELPHEFVVENLRGRRGLHELNQQIGRVLRLRDARRQFLRRRQRGRRSHIGRLTSTAWRSIKVLAETSHRWSRSGALQITTTLATRQPKQTRILTKLLCTFRYLSFSFFHICSMVARSSSHDRCVSIQSIVSRKNCCTSIS